MLGRNINGWERYVCGGSAQHGRTFGVEERSDDMLDQGGGIHLDGKPIFSSQYTLVKVLRE